LLSSVSPLNSEAYFHASDIIALYIFKKVKMFCCFCKVRRKAAAFQQSRKLFAHSFLLERSTSGVMPGRKPYAQSFLWERRTSGVTQSRKLFPLKKSPALLRQGLFYFI
jgi:hypothetical protein